MITAPLCESRPRGIVLPGTAAILGPRPSWDRDHPGTAAILAATNAVTVVSNRGAKAQPFSRGRAHPGTATILVAPSRSHGRFKSPGKPSPLTGEGLMNGQHAHKHAVAVVSNRRAKAQPFNRGRAHPGTATILVAPSRSSGRFKSLGKPSPLAGEGTSWDRDHPGRTITQLRSFRIAGQAQPFNRGRALERPARAQTRSHGRFKSLGKPSPLTGEGLMNGQHAHKHAVMVVSNRWASPAL